MACTDYEETPDPLTVFTVDGSCCQQVPEVITNYDPPAQGSQIDLTGNLFINVSPGVVGAVMPSGSLTAGLNLNGSIGPSGILSTLTLLGLGPYAWYDASDPNGDTTTPANGATLDQWTDKSGNNRHMPYDAAINRKPKFWSIANSGSGSPTALPNTGLPIVSTVQGDAIGIRAFGTVSGGPLAMAAAGSPGGNWTAFVVGRKADPPGVITFLGSWCQFGGGSDQPMIVGVNDTGTPDVFYMGYRNQPAGTQHRQQYTLGAITSNEYWRFTIQRNAGTHTCWQHDTSLAVQLTAGTPSDQPFILQWLARYQNNVLSDILFQYEFAEVILFSKVLTTPERDFVWGYLDDKWGLS